MEKGGTAPSSPPLLWKGRAGLCSCSTARGNWINLVKLDGGGTFANKLMSSEIFLKGHIDSITYNLSFFWRCPCTLTTVLLPAAVLSWAVQLSWPLHRDTLQPLWVLWLGSVWSLDFFPLNSNYSQSSFSGFFSTFILSWHLLIFSCKAACGAN